MRRCFEPRFPIGHRRVLVLVQEEARLLSHSFIGTSTSCSASSKRARESRQGARVARHLARGRAREGRGDDGRARSARRGPRRSRRSDREGPQLSPAGGNCNSATTTRHRAHAARPRARGRGRCRSVLISLGADLARVRRRVIQLLLATRDVRALWMSRFPACFASAARAGFSACRSARVVSPGGCAKDGDRMIMRGHGRAGGARHCVRYRLDDMDARDHTGSSRPPKVQAHAQRDAPVEDEGVGKSAALLSLRSSQAGARWRTSGRFGRAQGCRRFQLREARSRPGHRSGRRWLARRNAASTGCPATRMSPALSAARAVEAERCRGMEQSGNGPGLCATDAPAETRESTTYQRQRPDHRSSSAVARQAITA